MGLGTAVRIAGAAVLLAACSTTVAGEGTLAPEALVPAGPPTASPATASPTRAPAPTPAPAPTRTAPRTPPPGTVPTAFAGHWRGRMAQPRGVITGWTAGLRLTAGGRTGSFSITGYCRGTVTVVAVGRSRLVLREVITSDPRNRCAASGIVRLTPAGAGRLRMTWEDGDHSWNTASGVLSKA